MKKKSILQTDEVISSMKTIDGTNMASIFNVFLKNDAVDLAI
jgi:hypothetical protein